MNFKLLNKDLNLYPTPGKYSNTSYNNDIKYFMRRKKRPISKKYRLSQRDSK